jgi:heme exporter protein D
MNWSHYLAMGGYGLYVWTSYATAALVLVFNLLSARRRTRQVRKQLQELARLDRAGNE